MHAFVRACVCVYTHARNGTQDLAPYQQTSSPIIKFQWPPKPVGRNHVRLRVFWGLICEIDGITINKGKLEGGYERLQLHSTSDQSPVTWHTASLTVSPLWQNPIKTSRWKTTIWQQQLPHSKCWNRGMCTHAAASSTCPAAAFSSETHQQEAACGKREMIHDTWLQKPRDYHAMHTNSATIHRATSSEFIGKGKQSSNGERNPTAN